MDDGTVPAASPIAGADAETGPGVGNAATEPHLTDLVADIWADLLEVPRDALGPGSHFFRLGGYSLLALRIVERLKSDAGLEADIALVLGRPVLSDFVAALPVGDAPAAADVEEGEL